MDKKARAEAILAKKGHQKPRPGTRDADRDDVPDLEHPDQRGWRQGDPGKPEPRP